MKRQPVLAAIIVLVTLALNAQGAIAMPPRAALAQPQAVSSVAGTGFTYQGQLKNASGPVSNTCDFQFQLYDAVSGPNQIGSQEDEPTVTVTGGLFTVVLNDTGQFGANAFGGDARWLEIDVRCPAGGGGFTTLAPRQPITPAPYALTIFHRTVVVKPVGTAAENGAALLVALWFITDNSASNPYLVHIEPGIYDVGPAALVMKPYVDIEGSGEDVTKITGMGNSNANTGTVEGASNAELRFLTVENTGGNIYAIAIYNSAASPRLTHVTATASGGNNHYGVYNFSSSPMMTNVTASASGVNNNYGVYNFSSSPMMTNVTASASGVNTGYLGRGTLNVGVYNDGSSPTMTDVTASASGSGSSGVANVFSSPVMTNVTATAFGDSLNSGVYNSYSSATIRNSVIGASGGRTNYGIFNSAGIDTYTVRLNNSQVTGSTSTIINDSAFTMRVGATLLDGGAVTGPGTFTCVGAYNGSYAALNSTCS